MIKKYPAKDTGQENEGFGARKILMNKCTVKNTDQENGLKKLTG